jgi:NAD(P)-dependent dehydrogenase (short-subunit alcohol dehydrogenase family)
VHEVGAAIATEYFNESNSKNQKAFCLVTAGPGITNAITGIAGAWLESRELLIVGGQVKTSDLSFGKVRQRGIQEIDGTSLVKSLTARSQRIDRPISKSELENILENNLISPFLIIQKFYKNCDKNKNCSIVNIGSIVGEKGFDELSAYGASKSALNGLTKCLMVEFSKKYKNIRINCVNPGFTKTSFYKKFKKNKKLYEWTLNKTPLNKWATTNDISNLVMFLLSEKSSYINGQCINIDGGWTSQ